MTDIQIHHGNCLDILPTLPDCSVDSIVTDPPYGLEFMGKDWDAPWKKSGDVIADPASVGGFQDGAGGNPFSRSRIRYGREGTAMIGFQQWCEQWAAECLRVLKPGGHLLAFGGTRTYHRMAVAIEDAGFEIRDSLHWIYGSGFPKSLNLSKTLDKMAGAPVKIGKAFKVAGEYGERDLRDPEKQGLDRDEMRHEAVTKQAKQWGGWGTALKPAHEPIVVARKPLVGTVAGNVLQYGTGALNIDGARVGRADNDVSHAGQRTATFGTQDTISGGDGSGGWEQNTAGRWPANIILTHNHDCEDICTDGCPVRELDRQSGTSRSQGGRIGKKEHGAIAIGGAGTFKAGDPGYGDVGGASRFFTVTEWDVPFRYVAKPGKKERNAGLDHLPAKKNAGSYEFRPDGSLDGKKTEPKTNHHPTVKPLALMRWLVRLVTPPNGTVLEPFAGSGTTLVACHLENFNAIGIEMTDEYLPIIEGRLAWAREQTEQQQLL
jgi:site-specific DNA-methyltransferase (adenine-specific)